ncbi:MAG: YceI family protein [Crocinitomicaceae bacterium]
MKNKFFYGVGIATFMLASCGGAEEAAEDLHENIEDVVEEVIVETKSYSVDTAASIVNWTTMDGEEKGHWGTVKVLEGSFSTEGDVITEASLKMNMNTVMSTDENGGENLTGHLMAPDFFDVNQYASSEFTFDRHEEGKIYGTLNAAGAEFPVEAEATLTEGTVEVAEFIIDMSTLPFYVAEREKEPNQEKWHDPNVTISATIVGK